MIDQLKQNLNEILEEKNTKLIPGNIKEGVTILGVEGILQDGADTSDATALANDIIAPKTAYINGEKITGTIVPVYEEVGDASLTISKAELLNKCFSWFISKDGKILVTREGETDSATYPRYYKFYIQVSNDNYEYVGQFGGYSTGTNQAFIADISDVNVFGLENCYLVLLTPATTIASGFVQAHLINVVTKEVTQYTLSGIANSYKKNILKNKGNSLLCCIFSSTSSSFNIYELTLDETTSNKILTSVYTNVQLATSSGYFSLNDILIIPNDQLIVVPFRKTVTENGQSHYEYATKLASLNEDSTFKTSIFIENRFIPSNSLNYVLVGNEIKQLTIDLATLEYTTSDVLITLPQFSTSNYVTYKWLSDTLLCLATTNQLIIYEMNYTDNTITEVYNKQVNFLNNNANEVYKNINYYIRNNIGCFIDTEKEINILKTQASEEKVLAALARDGETFYNPIGSNIDSTDIISGKIGYNQSGKVIGTLELPPIDSEDYNNCLNLANEILGINN